MDEYPLGWWQKRCSAYRKHALHSIRCSWLSRSFFLPTGPLLTLPDVGRAASGIGRFGYLPLTACPQFNPYLSPSITLVLVVLSRTILLSMRFSGFSNASTQRVSCDLNLSPYRIDRSTVSCSLVQPNLLQSSFHWNLSQSPSLLQPFFF